MFLRTLNRNIVNLEHVHSIEKHSYKKQQHGKLVQLYSISVNYPMFQSEGEAFRDDSVQIVSDLTESQANFYLDEIAKGVGTCLGLNAMDIVKLEKISTAMSLAEQLPTFFAENKRARDDLNQVKGDDPVLNELATQVNELVEKSRF